MLALVRVMSVSHSNGNTMLSHCVSDVFSQRLSLHHLLTIFLPMDTSGPGFRMVCLKDFFFTYTMVGKWHTVDTVLWYSLISKSSPNWYNTSLTCRAVTTRPSSQRATPALAWITGAVLSAVPPSHAQCVGCTEWISIWHCQLIIGVIRT